VIQLLFEQPLLADRGGVGHDVGHAYVVPVAPERVVADMVR
jgi:hypothetical protein